MGGKRCDDLVLSWTSGSYSKSRGCHLPYLRHPSCQRCTHGDVSGTSTAGQRSKRQCLSKYTCTIRATCCGQTFSRRCQKYATLGTLPARSTSYCGVTALINFAN